MNKSQMALDISLSQIEINHSNPNESASIEL